LNLLRVFKNIKKIIYCAELNFRPNPNPNPHPHLNMMTEICSMDKKKEHTSVNKCHSHSKGSCLV
jgi:hypothetical protein